MVEKTIIDYLSEKLNIPVHAERPKEASGRFLVVERLGGNRTNQIYYSSIAIQSYADSLYEAAELDEDVVIQMIGDGEEVVGIIEEPDIAEVSLNSHYNYTDIDYKNYRYQAVFDISHY